MLGRYHYVVCKGDGVRGAKLERWPAAPRVTHLEACLGRFVEDSIDTLPLEARPFVPLDRFHVEPNNVVLKGKNGGMSRTS